MSNFKQALFYQIKVIVQRNLIANRIDVKYVWAAAAVHCEGATTLATNQVKKILSPVDFGGDVYIFF